MFRNLFSDIISGNKFLAGLELFIHSNDEHRFNLMILQKKKDSISVKSSHHDISLQQAIEIIGTEIPVVLSVGGKRISINRLTFVESDNDQSLLNKIMPSIRAEEFYIQRNIISGDELYFSYARKEALDDIIAKLKENGLTIIACSIGPFALSNIIPALPTANEIVSDHYKVMISAAQMNEVSSSTSDNELFYTIGDESVSSHSIVAFASAFGYLINTSPIPAFEFPTVEIDRQEFAQKNIFKKASFYLVSVIVLALVVNFIFSAVLFSKKEKLNTQLQMGQAVLTRYQSLNKELSEKKDLLEKTGLIEASRTSYYADQLAMDMPESIRLTKLDINPLIKKANQDEDVVSFETKVVRAEGLSRKSTELNDWIKTIKKKTWVSNASLVSFVQERSENEGKFVVQLEIK